MKVIILALTLWTGGPSMPVYTLEYLPEGIRVTGILTQQSRVFSEEEFQALVLNRYTIVERINSTPLPPLPRR